MRLGVSVTAILLCFAISGISACSYHKDNANSLAGAPEFPKQIYARKDCSGAQSSDPGIIGGQSVAAASWLAQTVVMLKHNVDQQGNGSFCTATLIDQNILLTAAHCVSDEDTRTPYDLSTLQVFFDANPLCDHDHFPKMTIDQVAIHPAWLHPSSGAGDRGDLALVRLAGVSPSAYRFSDLSSVGATGANSLISAGYGDSFFVNDPYSSFRLKFADTQVLKDPATIRLLAIAQFKNDFPSAPVPSAELSRTGPEAADSTAMLEEVRRFDNSGEGEFVSIDQTEGQGICSGDSGGPLFDTVNGKHRIVGVASFVMDPDPVESKNQITICTKYGIYSSISHYANWIEQNFQQLKNDESLRASPFANSP